MKRDGITEEEALQRISHQLTDEEKMSLSQFIILNDEQQLLIPQVLKTHKSLL